MISKAVSGRHSAKTKRAEGGSLKADLEDKDLLAIRLMRMGAKKRPSYRIVVKEKLSKRDGAYLENLGFYNPTQNPAELRLDDARAQYWLERGAQPTETVRRLIKANQKAQQAQTTDAESTTTTPASA
jgi:small subunit ribosomal protein S16